MAAAATIDAADLTRFTAALLKAAGTPAAHAATVAGALVEADRQAAPSHGVMLLPMYLQRVAAGSIDPAGEGTIVSDHAGAVVMDAGHAFGQVTSARAVGLAVERARNHAAGVVSVREGFHFGTAGRWVRAMAHQGCIGVAMSNTRPLMPAPGGSTRVVGNNPIAIAAPAEGEPPVCVDMALSAAAMGKIRMAQAAGATLPDGWAADAAGLPTTDPAAAISGMLLPAAGPKGFGLAMMADILCGGLSSGAIGAEVAGLYGDPAVPYRCAHFFLAIDVAAFRPLAGCGAAVAAFLGAIRHSPPVAGGPPVRVPGERPPADTCRLAPAPLPALRSAAARLGWPLPPART